MNETSKIAGATGGAVGLSALALAFGACCVAPWAVALLGIGGALMLARLAFVQPYVVVATVALMALGFWYAYRSVRPTENCPAKNRTHLRWFVWVGAAIVIAIDIGSYAPLFLF